VVSPWYRRSSCLISTASRPAAEPFHNISDWHRAAEQEQTAQRSRRARLIVQAVQVGDLAFIHHQRWGLPRMSRCFCVSSVATMIGASMFSERSPVAMPTSQPRARHSASLSLASARGAP
jgi:hypothetical protein